MRLKQSVRQTSGIFSNKKSLFSNQITILIGLSLEFDYHSAAVSLDSWSLRRIFWALSRRIFRHLEFRNGSENPIFRQLKRKFIGSGPINFESVLKVFSAKSGIQILERSWTRPQNRRSPLKRGWAVRIPRQSSHRHLISELKILRNRNRY